MAPHVDVTDWMDSPAPAVEGAPEFAVGDVHGMSMQFVAILDAMAEKSQGFGHLTLLGDLCDRGPDTMGCYKAAFGNQCGAQGFSGRTALVGNHEIYLLSILDGGERAARALPNWIRNGGGTVVEELGLDPACVRPRELADALVSALGQGVVGCIQGMESHRDVGGILFVHGGVHPYHPLDAWFAKPRLWFHNEDHYAWIRFPFFGHEGGFEGGRMVVHGHTPEDTILRWKGLDGRVPHRFDGSRLGLDGGSFSTGRIAAVEFRDEAYRVFTSA